MINTTCRTSTQEYIQDKPRQNIPTPKTSAQSWVSHGTRICGIHTQDVKILSQGSPSTQTCPNEPQDFTQPLEVLVEQPEMRAELLLVFCTCHQNCSWCHKPTQAHSW